VINDLILCENFTNNGDPINRTNQFSPSNSFVVCLAILDSVEINTTINTEVIWRFKSNIILHQKQKFLVDNKCKRHRLESFIKMAFIEYNKMYGKWSVTLIVNGKEISSQNFLVIKPVTIYGTNFGNTYSSTNSLINITS